MPELSLAELLRPELAELSAYVPVQGQFAVRLDANEAPPLLGAAARGRLAEEASRIDWERYPDATHGELRTAIARSCNAEPSEVLAGVGSDEVISLLLTVLCRPRNRSGVPTIVTTTPTFVMYKMSARVRGMRVVEVPLDSQWDIAATSLVRAIEMSSPNLVFVASPNNPTGTMASADRLEQVILAANGALVVIDEAYVAYANRHQLDLLRRHDNVAVLRTLSKVGLAALRVGWLLAPPALVAELDKARLPYNLPTPSQRLAVVALSELSSELERILHAVISERQRLADELTNLGVAVTPSQANFLWIRTEQAAGTVFEGLSARGVLVRSFHDRGGRLSNQLRVTIGTREQNDAFLAALCEVL